jgi:hypothetical protein
MLIELTTVETPVKSCRGVAALHCCRRHIAPAEETPRTHGRPRFLAADGVHFNRRARRVSMDAAGAAPQPQRISIVPRCTDASAVVLAAGEEPRLDRVWRHKSFRCSWSHGSCRASRRVRSRGHIEDSGECEQESLRTNDASVVVGCCDGWARSGPSIRFVLRADAEFPQFLCCPRCRLL